MNNENLFAYILQLADDRLILGHRLSEWCGHAPILEEDIALSNIALDCIGQANLLYTIASELDSQKRTPDQLVYFREAIEYKNCLLVEQPNGDFAQTIVRQFLFDAFAVILYKELKSCLYEPLAQVASKALKEIRYHHRHSSNWILRLGDGTEESHKRSQNALNILWKFTDEFFLATEVEQELQKRYNIPSPEHFRTSWLENVTLLLQQATLNIPEPSPFLHRGGRIGKHSEHLGHLLAEMQIVARSFPAIQW